MAQGLVLITGATGNLGFRTLTILLESGYSARIAIRAAEQEQRLLNQKSIKPYAGKVQFVLVPDITVKGAYNEAVKGVDYVLHIASPISSNSKYSGETWSEVFYIPAKQGTIGMLEAAKQQSTVKRIVITSSVAVLHAPEGEKFIGPYDIEPEPTEEKAASAVRYEAYSYSKLYAYNVATEFVKNNQVSFDLVRVMPGFIQGANELNQTREEALNGSNKATLDTALGNITDAPKFTAQVLLDDVARAHVVALDSAKVSGGENLVVCGNEGKGVPWDEVSTLIAKLYPEEVAKGVLNPKSGQKSSPTFYDVQSSQKSLGYKFAGIEQMLKSAIGQYLSLD